jgi:hypothetical protein
MPLYPPAPTSLTGDVFSISRFMNQPAFVNRRLRTLTDRKFIADYLLPGRIQAQGGAIAYAVGEPIETDRAPGAVNPGAEYPRALAPLGTSALVSVTKWGQDVPLTDEAVGRQDSGQISADRVLTKVGNRIIQQVDALVLAGIATAVTQTQGAAASWSAAGADPFLDVMLASTQVTNLTEGFETDTVVVKASLYARLVANQKVISGLARETTNSVTTTGEVKVIAGHALLPVPDSRMPSGVDVIVMDRMQLGSLGYERIPSPEYTGDPATGIESMIRRDPNATDSWLIRGRRPVVPVIQEPASAVKITGA